MLLWFLCVYFFTGNMNLVVLMTTLLLGNSSQKVDMSVIPEEKMSTYQDTNWQSLWKQSAESVRYQGLWEQFKYTYNKFYFTEKEDKRRMNVFIDNVKFIDDHNQLFAKGLSTFELGHNEFMDLTHEEFLNKYTTYTKSSLDSRERLPAKFKLTVRYDSKIRYYPYPSYESIYNDRPIIQGDPTFTNDPNTKNHPTVQNDPTLRSEPTVRYEPTDSSEDTVFSYDSSEKNNENLYDTAFSSDSAEENNENLYDTLSSYDSVQENNENLLSEENLEFMPPANVQIPMVVDWRPTGAVTPVKNQGKCKASWLFSATGALEGQLYRKYRNTTTISEQNILDCSDKSGNDGCHNGTAATAYKYIITNGGVNTNLSYPWYGKQCWFCHYKKLANNPTVRGIVAVQSGNETALAAAVATVGPISVAVDASSKTFQFYKRGIYNDTNCSRYRLNYAMLAVGYGRNYWVVKNSIGTAWGVKGYIFMSKYRGNQCGIATRALYPLV